MGINAMPRARVLSFFFLLLLLLLLLLLPMVSRYIKA